jgi:ribosomal protein L16 Arg81 hydroxylase
MPDKNHLQELAKFIREHRSSEGHFETLYKRLVAEQQTVQQRASEPEQEYAMNLTEALEKHAATYQQHKETGGSAWPEFENFVSHFEKSVMDALHRS